MVYAPPMWIAEEVYKFAEYAASPLPLIPLILGGKAIKERKNNFSNLNMCTVYYMRV